MIGDQRQRLVEEPLRLRRVVEPFPGDARQIAQHRRARVRIAGDLQLPGEHAARLVPVRLCGEDRGQRVERLGAVGGFAQRRLERVARLGRIVELLAVDAAGVQQRLHRLGPAGQRLGLAHPRRGIGGEVVGLEVQAGQRAQRGGVVGRGLQRRLDLLERGCGIVEIVELEQRELQVQLGDARLVGAALAAPLEINPLRQHPRRFVGQARSAQVAKQHGQQVVVGDGFGPELAQGPGGRLGVVEAILQDLHPPADDLDLLAVLGQRRPPLQDLLQIVEPAARLVQAIERLQRLRVVRDLGQHRFVGLDGAVGEGQLLFVDGGDLHPQGTRLGLVFGQVGAALQALDRLRPEANARVEPGQRLVARSGSPRPAARSAAPRSSSEDSRSRRSSVSIASYGRSSRSS